MTVDLHNYEAFYLDYIEGQLSREEEAELYAFLELHPECKPEIENFAFIPLVTCNIKHPDTDSLKKLDFEVRVSESNFEDFSIAYYEGLLSAHKTTELFNKANTNPSLRTLLADYSKTMVAADASVVYPTKSDLKKRAATSHSWVAYGAAASLAILMVTASVMNRPKPAIAVKIISNAPAKEVTGITESASLTTVVTRKTITPKAAHSKPSVDRTVEPIIHSEPVINSEPEVVAEISPNDTGRQTETVASIQSIETKPTVTTLPTDSIRSLPKLAEAYHKAIINPIQNIRKKRFSMYGLLRDGINGLGSITSLKIHMDTDVDSTGKVSAYSISAGSLGYYNTVAR
jgi:hypothetical protein